MKSYVEITRSLIKPLVSDIQNVEIREISEEENKHTVVVMANSHDLSVLIGRGGATASALRRLLNIQASANKDRVYLKFESFNEVK